MGILSKYPMHAVGVERTVIAGTFTTVNDAAPTIKYGEGFTVARNAEGAWTVTFNDTAAKLLSFTATIAMETLTNFPVLMLDQDNVSASSVKILLFSTADCSSTNFAASDEPGSDIHFTAVLADSDVG